VVKLGLINVCTFARPRHQNYDSISCATISAPLPMMALFLLRSSYRMLVAVCLLLGVNVFTFYVLTQGEDIHWVRPQHIFVSPPA